MKYKLCVKILVYSRFENVQAYLFSLVKSLPQVFFFVNDDSGEIRNYPKEDNFYLSRTNKFGHDESYKKALTFKDISEYSYIVSDAIELTKDSILRICDAINSNKSIYFISTKDIAEIDQYWYLTKTGFVIYKTELLSDDIIELKNFPQLNLITYLSFDDVDFINLNLNVINTKKSYWESTMYQVWFVDFYNALVNFFNPNSSISIVKRHSRENKFFSVRNLIRWRIKDTINSIHFLLWK